MMALLRRLLGVGFVVIIFNGIRLLGAVVADGGANYPSLSGKAEANGALQMFARANLLSTANGRGTLNFVPSWSSNVAHGFTTTVTHVAENVARVEEGPIPASYFGMSIESAGYNFGHPEGEEWPAIPISIVRSLAVWSPGDGSKRKVHWADLNPSKGIYDFSALDVWINESQSHGVQMIYTLAKPPAWAGGSKPDPAALQEFVSAIVTHAAGRIQYWEGFNEYQDTMTVSIAEMVRLQEILFETAHRIDPSCIVLSPTDSGVQEKPMRSFLKAGGGSWFDVAAVHGYNDTSGEGVIRRISNFRAALAAGGQGGKPIWDTEWGWWHAGELNPDSLPDQNAQVAFVSTNLILQWALGVRRQLYYAYDDVDHGIYDYQTRTLTPAGVAYLKTTLWLSGATMPNGYQVDGTVYTARLLRDGNESLIVWDSGGSTPFSANGFARYEDLSGQTHAVANGVVTIGRKPILLQTSRSGGTKD